MGLDMYLKAKKYVSGFAHSPGFGSDVEAYKAIADALGIVGDGLCKDNPLMVVQVTVAYWRKANQIHHWFVKNVQNGEDKCNEHQVSRDQLEELVHECKQVLSHRDRAMELLPTRSGCFFGGTEIDDWYFEDLENTIKQLRAVLDNPAFEDWDFYYRSSW